MSRYSAYQIKADVCHHHTLPGLRLLIPEPGETGFLAPDAALRKLLPTVGMCDSLVSE